MVFILDRLCQRTLFVHVALDVNVTEKSCLSGRAWPYTHFATRVHVVIFYIVSNMLPHLYTVECSIGNVNERNGENQRRSEHSIETETAVSTILSPPYSLSR